MIERWRAGKQGAGEVVGGCGVAWHGEGGSIAVDSGVEHQCEGAMVVHSVMASSGCVVLYYGISDEGKVKYFFFLLCYIIIFYFILIFIFWSCIKPELHGGFINAWFTALQ